MSKEGDWLVHHGVSGQKWGVRNGPPYPLTGAEKADIKAINPKYTGLDGGYSNNCSNCTMAYELRKRGFDVTAKPLFGGRAVDTVREVFGNPKERTPDLSNVKTGFGSTKQYVNAVKADIGKNMPDGARGGIYLAFNGGGSGHIFNWTKSGGQVSFVDAQDSGRNADKNFNNSVRDSVRYFRTDNAKINMSLLNEQVTNRKR